tara:strand:+ start:139 stop:744 length:606 start_codon:yes stop_codon:yes gene_type:complete
MSKVFGIGWAKTGTTTLGRCLEILGYNHQTQKLWLAFDYGKKDFSRIFDVVDKYDSFEDWPWLLMYKEFDKQYPGSKFILTTRGHSSWVDSYKNMVKTQGKASKHMNKVRSILYDLPFPNVTNEQLINRYNLHVANVQEYFKDRPDDLLIINWKNGDNWEKICPFLGKEIPNQDFPHANKGDYKKPKPNYILKRIKELFFR